jgi:hypothetical protein
MSLWEWRKCCYIPFPIGSMYAIYGNIYHQYTPFMWAYIPAPWILWVMVGWIINPPRNSSMIFPATNLRVDFGDFQRLAMGDIAGPTSLNRDARKKDGAWRCVAVPFPMWGSIHWW